MDYARRIVDSELDDLFGEIPALALDGPKAVGKTTTARQRVQSVVQLDNRSEAGPVAADPSIILRRPQPILLDEWQKVPAVWDVVRHAADDDPGGGRFLLAGSASPRPEATAHSGAGRIGRLRMRPMTLSERAVAKPTISLRRLLSGTAGPLEGDSPFALADYVEEICASGFPGMRRLGSRALRFQLDSYLRYLRNAVDRDVADQGLAVRRPEAMMAWLRAYAAATGSTASYSQILDAATPGESDKPARSTANTYREALASLWLLDPVPAWSPTGGEFWRGWGRGPSTTWLIPRSPLGCWACLQEPFWMVRASRSRRQWGGMVGPLFESLATLCLRVPAQAAEAEVFHLRTRNGDHEVDLVIVRPDGRFIAVEVKLAAVIEDSDGKHLRWLREQVGERMVDAIIVHTGPHAYRRPDGIGVVPLALLAE